MQFVKRLEGLTPSIIASSSFIFVLGIFFVAANLRAPITGIAPLLDKIIATFELSNTQAGMLTTLPLIAFAVSSPMAAKLARKIGIEGSLFIALLLIGGGINLRLMDSVWALYSATAIIGVGIAIGNVLLPSLIKRDFAARVAVMTSCYVLAMGIFSGGFSAIVTPLANIEALDWQGALSVFSLITLVSLLLWVPRLRSQTMPDVRGADISGIPGGNPLKTSKVWHFPLAWQVTIFLGLNSFMTYILIGWLPNILVEAGHTPEYAGVLHGWLQVASAVPGFVLIPLLPRLKDQRVPAVVMSILGSTSALGLLYAPQFALLWTILVGFSSGGCFILGLSFISFRSQDAMQAASLSGMAQSFGYSLAAIGPMLAGYMYSSLGNWSGGLWLCASASFCCAIVGLGCGRDKVLPK
ncbi:CynX/NimT family MFS transporter [Paraglaciecola polaris]|uniref:Major facilitator transporter n=1 Tax=Paraglaciecola polaris LMG 21857 TaxID=1129793 RepID=K6YPU5_9ALTE|nr:CynX/NimT family MFS transporter [Paraglaciecola polaris]GAC34759.1 major facilitator transporter [Paraglaciecola polaris LMG 21857]|tara:strand:+ start:16139 stop:17371 length:1233 start_codon:yes stop_codon:yes gene_type:complete